MPALTSSNRSRRRFAAIALILAVALGVWPALGQPEALENLPDLSLSVADVGPGGAARAGDWVGLRVSVTENRSEPNEVVLRLAFEDQDGDRAFYDRVISTTPGRAEAYWVYGRLPFWTRSMGSIEVRAYDAVRTETVGDRGFGVRAGALLAIGEASAGAATQPWNDVMGVVGRRDLDLRRYQAGTAGQSDKLSLWHYATTVAAGLSVDDLPDRWMGLAPMSALVWAESSAAFDPTRLAGTDKAAAIRAWVERGGHLVIIWPSLGEEWSSASANPLVDLLPAMRVTTRESVDLEPYRWLLTPSRDAPLPEGETVHVFSPAPDAGVGDAIPVINGRDGACVVMRRLVGAGMVTVVGLDVTSERLRGIGAPRAENFWHRVLGRRGEFLTELELAEQFPDQGANIGRNRGQNALDSDLERAILREGQSAGALLLAVVVFALYWVLAGPVGFLILKRSGYERFAWPAFVGAIVVFTVISWTGATVLRPRRVDARHLAIVEQVHGEATQRGRMWSSVLVPRYGEATFAVGDTSGAEPAAGARRSGDLIAPWEGFEPDVDVSTFPDNRGYRLRTQSPDGFSVPVRSTVKQVRVDWAGSARLAMPGPATLVGEAEAAPIEITEDGRLTGVLAHELPGPLEDITILWVTRQLDLTRTRGGTLPFSVSGVSLPADFVWAPSVRLDLAEATSASEDRRNVAVGPLLNRIRSLGEPLTRTVANVRSAGLLTDRLRAASLLSVAGPPELSQGIAQTSNAVRVSTHAYDLGKWMTQPCVIVVGFLRTEGAAPPVPLTVDGDVPPSSGLTMVRWIYPLPANPPGWAGDDDETTGG